MLRRALLGLALVFTLAGCGGGGGGGNEGTAELWVTRDRGSEVVLTATVPAGLTVIQALEREAEIETRYGGRFVHAIDGIEGRLGAQRDWFYFVNGIQPDRGGAEVRLRAGDVAWWDLRSWRGERLDEPLVVVGALPEPFLHGWDGRRRPVELRAPPELEAEAEMLRETLGGDGGSGRPNVFVLAVRPAAGGATLDAKRGAANDGPVEFTLAGSLEAVRAATAALARDPRIVRFRYEARFDEQGKVVR